MNLMRTIRSLNTIKIHEILLHLTQASMLDIRRGIYFLVNCKDQPRFGVKAGGSSIKFG